MLSFLVVCVLLQLCCLMSQVCHTARNSGWQLQAVFDSLLIPCMAKVHSSSLNWQASTSHSMD
jgi:hypothetical protein